MKKQVNTAKRYLKDLSTIELIKIVGNGKFYVDGINGLVEINTVTTSKGLIRTWMCEADGTESGSTKTLDAVLKSAWVSKAYSLEECTQSEVKQILNLIEYSKALQEVGRQVGTIRAANKAYDYYIAGELVVDKLGHTRWLAELLDGYKRDMGVM